MWHGCNAKSCWCLLSRRSLLCSRFKFTCIWLHCLVFGLDCAGSKTGWSQWSLLASNSTNPWLTLHYIAHLGLLHFVSKTSVSQPLLICLCKHCGSHPYKISETKCFKFFCEVPPQDLLLLYSTSELLNIREEGINCAPENCAIHQKGNPERTEPPWREKLLFLFQKGGSIFQISRSITNTGSPSA